MLPGEWLPFIEETLHHWGCKNTHENPRNNYTINPSSSSIDQVNMHLAVTRFPVSLIARKGTKHFKCTTNKPQLREILFLNV